MKTNEELGYSPGVEIYHGYAEANPYNCAVKERTGDGIPVGACCFFLEYGTTCPRHGKVKTVGNDTTLKMALKDLSVGDVLEMNFALGRCLFLVNEVDAISELVTFSVLQTGAIIEFPFEMILKRSPVLVGTGSERKWLKWIPFGRKLRKFSFRRTDPTDIV